MHTPVVDLIGAAVRAIDVMVGTKNPGAIPLLPLPATRGVVRLLQHATPREFSPEPYPATSSDESDNVTQ